ncbi:conjugal transfer protein TraK [Gramella sp. GC03-9]|uniref:Conjugal transfer protein TraK n=1 Tax=Christiangramia oceanisediminis TaxID=2920386 RepID=A0A9X2KZX8_9FLAO|nr:conjugal transfer protein TraK [Gramella oceanisediminis]MCP9201301.1 conjugal transfer protein TraK [Gramella oceanisediminis]
MKSPYLHIYKVLRLNRFIVVTVIIIAFGSSLVSLFQVRKIQEDLLGKAFVVSQEGMVIPLELVEENENLEVEAKAHLAQFYRYFYDLNTSNYKSNLEKALWLGNQSVDDIYRQKKSDGVYNRLLQYSLVQQIQSIETELDLSNAPYSFTSVIDFQVNRGSTIDTYRLTTSGNLLKVDRQFPRNPHGLLITNYFENSLKKLADETR